MPPCLPLDESSPSTVRTLPPEVEATQKAAEAAVRKAESMELPFDDNVSEAASTMKMLSMHLVESPESVCFSQHGESRHPEALDEALAPPPPPPRKPRDPNLTEPFVSDGPIVKEVTVFDLAVDEDQARKDGDSSLAGTLKDSATPPRKGSFFYGPDGSLRDAISTLNGLNSSCPSAVLRQANLDAAQQSRSTPWKAAQSGSHDEKISPWHSSQASSRPNTSNGLRRAATPGSAAGSATNGWRAATPGSAAGSGLSPEEERKDEGGLIPASPSLNRMVTPPRPGPFKAPIEVGASPGLRASLAVQGMMNHGATALISGGGDGEQGGFDRSTLRCDNVSEGESWESV